MSNQVGCEGCGKVYNIDSMYFEDDPTGLVCSACYTQDVRPSDLGIDVGEDIAIDDHAR